MANGTTAESLATPGFVIEEDIEDTKRQWLDSFQTKIKREPVRYLRALQTMGPLATKGTAELHESVNLGTGTEISLPQSDIYTYFAARLDRSHWYDEQTSHAMDSDEKAISLRSDLADHVNYTVKKSSMSSMQRSDEAAPDARDGARRYNLEFYMWQVIESRLQQADETLRSTG